jgi:hypothetical protein
MIIALSHMPDVPNVCLPYTFLLWPSLAVLIYHVHTVMTGLKKVPGVYVLD